MKKHVVIVAMLCLLCFGAWAEGQAEEPATEMDRIVYLSAEHHDSPEMQALWAEEFERITGVPVEMRTVSSAQAHDSMLALFMSGDVPDVVKYGGDDPTTLARQEFIIPLDPFIEGSSEVAALKEMYPESFAAHSWNGISYGIPDRVGSSRGLWVRTDILDAVGLGIPQTLDDLVEALIAIRDNYPGPDGQPMHPYVSKTYHHAYMSVLSNYFDVSPNPIMRRPGDEEFRCGWDSPQFQDYAEFVKMLWDEDLIDPDHALPQKASNTRSKLYAGDAAFLAMWVNNYPGMIGGLRENFPDADIVMVPPIINPEGGQLGMSVVPGYRPYCITSEAADPQFVWDTFIETIINTVEGAMLQARGVPGFSYTVSDGMFIDNGDVSGSHLAAKTPLNPNIVFPYTMSPDLQVGVDMETEFAGWFSEHGHYAVSQQPAPGVASYDAVRSDMDDVKDQLFWKYVIGEISFDELIEQFNAYKDEIGFDAILAEVNAAQ